MMKRKPVNLASLLILGLCFLAGITRYSKGQLITPEQIRDIQNKNILSDSDLQTLSQYIKEQFTAIMAEESFSAAFQDAAQNLIQSASTNNKTSEETVKKYSDTYAQAVNEMSAVAMKVAASKEDQNLANQIRYSTVSVLSNTDNPILFDSMMGLVENNDYVIRYQAIRSFSTPNMIQYFQQEQGQEKADALVEKILSILEKDNPPDVIRQCAYSAASANPRKGVDVLLKCIVKRLPFYTNWTAEQETNDLDLFTLCFDLLNNPSLQGQENESLQKDMVKSAGELYSAAYYRYAKGTQQKDEKGQVLSVLSSDSQTQLQTFLVEAELILVRAASQKDNNIAPGGGRFLKMLSTPNRDLDRVYELLLSNTGYLNRAFKLTDAGENSPPLFPPIPDPPASLIEQAKNIRDAQSNTLKIEESRN